MRLFISFLYPCLAILLLVSCTTDHKPVYQLTTDSNPAEAGIVAPEQGAYNDGTEVTITATPNEGWVFNSWQGDLGGSENPDTLIMNSDKNISALFIKKTYPLTVISEGEGSVREAVVQEKSTDYEHGTLVELTAEPDQNWQFTGWSGAIESSENPVQVTVLEPMEVTATFEPMFYDVEIQTDGVGTVDLALISGEKLDDKYELGSVIKLTAKPAEEWTFLRWDVNNKDYENNPIEITINGHKTIRALFGSGNPFYLAENGVTIKCPTAEVGEKGTVNGIEYEAVDRGLLIDRLKEGADLSNVCTSLFTNMSYLFENYNSFNQPIGNWDVSNVIEMEGMFLSAGLFNQPLEHWDVSNVQSTYRMFSMAGSFNQPIGNWDVSSVVDMTTMFSAAASFNQPIGDWDVSKVTIMAGMFGAATSFNQPIGNWNVSNVKFMFDMFYDARSFNQDLTTWCVSNIDSEPQEFSTNSPLEDENKPIWGACPD